MHTALDMILEDRLVAPYINMYFSRVFPWLVAFIIMTYGVLKEVDLTLREFIFNFT